ncbi:MAG TPA: anhydro-N-acetylmuramic acid kinase [Acidiferrobacter sp.]|nr:anhydro-N-acetylmuramic acid kinase [Acidiferrobacter sp.]
MPEHYIGLMSGTSADGVDAVCVQFGDEPSVVIHSHYYQAYPEPLRARLLALMTPGANEIERMGPLEVELAEIFASASIAAREAAELPAATIRAIGSHGQTLRHRPNGRYAFTLQIGDPARIAELTGIATIADFRRRDIAAGGQGAPLVPAFHHWLFQHETRTRAIINIGGIANVTHIPSKITGRPVLGFDTGPGNALLDAWIRAQTGAAHDTDGHYAAQGQVHQGLLALLRDEPYFDIPPPKSTGREHFTLAWLDDRLKQLPQPIAAVDVQATLTQFTAVTLADAIAPLSPDEVFLCGGGTANPVLMNALTQTIASPVMTTSDLGLDPRLVEPVAFAWLARQTVLGRPGNAPSATGARHGAVLGAVYPA